MKNTYVFESFYSNFEDTYLQIEPKGVNPKDGRMQVICNFGLISKPGNLCMPIFKDVVATPVPSNNGTSKQSALSIVAFFLIQPGDTDPDYFDNYTKEQSMFASAHAERIDGRKCITYKAYRAKLSKRLKNGKR